MIQLYGHELSGNSYKVQLLLSLLRLEYEWINVDLLKGEHRSSEFLELNPFGQVPLLMDGDVKLADAQAILVYLARQYGGDQWLPLEAIPLSHVVRWLSIAAGEVRQGPEHARLYHLFGATRINIDRAIQKAEFILTQLNRHLSDGRSLLPAGHRLAADHRDWLELGHPTIADVAVFPYIALAPDGNINLAPYTHVLAWIERIKRLPGFVGMPGIAAPAAV
jgi:glutathione S-transferase